MKVSAFSLCWWSTISSVSQAWVFPMSSSSCCGGTMTRTASLLLHMAQKDDTTGDPLGFSGVGDDFAKEKKLGIDLGAMLAPLSATEAADLKAAATEIINDAIAEGIDEIGNMRQRMNREFEQQRKTMVMESELNTKRESAKLLDKIDAMTGSFLASTEPSRRSTKLAAAADQAMEGRGVDLGSWGMIKGASVAMGNFGSSLLGSVDKAQRTIKSSGKEQNDVVNAQQENRILVLADESTDEYAKKLVPALTDKLKQVLPGLQVDVFKPTATFPIGGNNAACVLLFATSFLDKSTVLTVLDRLLRKTIQPGGTVGQPPTQLVVVSTLGTERTNKVPYSLQNFVGGKLDKRRQIEEAVINIVRQRGVEPALDFSICKVGELKESVAEPFSLEPGDVLDGSISIQTAITALSQAIAFQPSARNSTFSVVGDLGGASQELLDDVFLKLDGPELWRRVLPVASAEKVFPALAEYVREWAELLAKTGKGLTTPVRMEDSDTIRVPGVKQVAGVKLLFLPTSTGKNYVSRDEEKTLESKGGSKTSQQPLRKRAKEGGIEFLVELTKANTLRVRAKRCDYAVDAVIKELSEATILSRVKESVDVWLKDHYQS